MGTTADARGTRGFTVLEALIVLVIVGITAVLAVGSFRGMGEKYRVEGETKQMYADLMDVRGRAMQRNRAFFVRFTTMGYRTYEDSNPWPDGDLALDTASDRQVADVTVRHAITTAGGVDNVTFGRGGIASATGNVRLSSPSSPDYDCVGIRPTRIHMGKHNGTTCVER